MSEISANLDAARTRLQAQPAHADYLTIEEAAELARCNPKTLRTAVHDGELRAFRPVKRLLFKDEDLRSWIEAKSATGTAARSTPASRARKTRRPAAGSVQSLKAIEARLTR